MSILAPVRVPVCNADGVIIERAGRSRLARLAYAPNSTVVRRPRRKGGGIVRVLLQDVGNDSMEDSRRNSSRVLSHQHETNVNPARVWTLKHIADSAADLFDTVVNEQCTPKRIPSLTADIFRAVILDLAA
jgi:hypothetical protein